MDTLSLLLSRFSVSAGVFYTGRICGVHAFPDDAQRGHLHLIERGPVDLIGASGSVRRIAAPTVLFLPRPARHRLVADESGGAQVLCATVRFGGSSTNNPISDSLPELVAVELDSLPGSAHLLSMVAQEAFGGEAGAQTAVDRLCELLIIRLLRYCLNEGLTTGGTLAGLSDPRLAKALAAVHRMPARAWQLESMAAAAGMSRSRFAAHFRNVIGQTPLHYLAGWRVTLAQGLLKNGRPIKQVCAEAGYASSSAFTRSFIRRVGVAPAEWLRRVEARPLAGPDDEPSASAAEGGGPEPIDWRVTASHQ